ncbi:aminotransferase class I/II-fold pyridoxal phosphate-dependent enzyme [Flaviaesturariibacter flavus]|uniref:Aminotransferase class I/II-fold pyridoxal phosphate-dependent enzyme n=1 Tax=Flaviaesturariibacter flavus TaxID=2502780 RepID=A0A4R1BPQ2_9BACT|nr:GntG family PLP-dependent aldolase [Flaviaesturariibacter flavus]TCJ19307.1 aminotransferase class I/II-fold pyridoxal phosphate-dependent enzyme [Flaviaesturariibacter flavus]
MIVDFRSDTVTKPTPAMLEAMMSAPVGDDVYGEDPTVNRLEALGAERFGMEAALFCPSGTMTNQIAIKVHTQPGDEVVCDQTAHVYQYEGGGIAFNAGASVRLLAGDRGRVTAEQVAAAVNPDDVHKPRTSLVCLENTSNRGGGSCYSMDEMKAIRSVCDEQGLILHLDGARLYNAIVANNEDPKDYGRTFHTVSLCLSKGLGAPVGSLLLGPADFIKRARRVRKVFGGGMRQAGFIAAGALYALENHVERLSQDHAHARTIAAALQNNPLVESVLPVETNIIIFNVAAGKTAAQLVAQLKESGILAYAIAPQQVRLVLHLDISPEMVDHTISTFRKVAAN